MTARLRAGREPSPLTQWRPCSGPQTLDLSVLSPERTCHFSPSEDWRTTCLSAVAGVTKEAVRGVGDADAASDLVREGVGE